MEAAARRFFRLAKGVEVAAFTVTKEQALDVQYQLAKETPVDAAKARSNWRLSVGRPLVGIIGPYRPFRSRWRPPYGSGGSKGERSNLNAVRAQGVLRLATYKKGSIYVSNNVPYINRLNTGWSNQAAPGWIPRAVMSAVLKTAPKIKKIFNKEFSK